MIFFFLSSPFWTLYATAADIWAESWWGSRGSHEWNVGNKEMPLCCYQTPDFVALSADVAYFLSMADVDVAFNSDVSTNRETED